MSRLEYQVVINDKHRIWAGWTCDCGSTMSSGDYWDDANRALAEANQGRVEHLALGMAGCGTLKSGKEAYGAEAVRLVMKAMVAK